MTMEYDVALRDAGVVGPSLNWFQSLPDMIDMISPSHVVGHREELKLTSIAKAVICGAGIMQPTGLVFVSRPVYEKLDTGERYTGADQLIAAVNNTPIRLSNGNMIQPCEVNGIKTSLFERDYWLGIGYTFLMMHLSSINVVDAQSRVGLGSYHESMVAMGMNKPVAWVVGNKPEIKEDKLDPSIPSYAGWKTTRSNVFAVDSIDAWLARKLTAMDMYGADMQLGAASSNLDELLAICALDLMVRDESFLKTFDIGLRNATVGHEKIYYSDLVSVISR